MGRVQVDRIHHLWLSNSLLLNYVRGKSYIWGWINKRTGSLRLLSGSLLLVILDSVLRAAVVDFSFQMSVTVACVIRWGNWGILSTGEASSRGVGKLISRWW